MSKKNIIKTAAVFLLMGTLMSGCIGMDLENKNQLEVTQDGKIIQRIVDDTDGNITGEDLEIYTDESISVAQSQGAAISLENCRVNNGKVNLQLNYGDANSYSIFNDVTCFIGTVKEAYDAGYDFNRTFKAVNGVEVPYFSLVSLTTDCKVLILEEPVTVKLPGEVEFISDGVTVESDGSVKVDENPDETVPEVFQTTTVEPVFIIYKA